MVFAHLHNSNHRRHDENTLNFQRCISRSVHWNWRWSATRLTKLKAGMASFFCHSSFTNVQVHYGPWNLAAPDCFLDWLTELPEPKTRIPEFEQLLCLTLLCSQVFNTELIDGREHHVLQYSDSAPGLQYNYHDALSKNLRAPQFSR